MSARKSRREWSTIIRAFERSGESHAAFCVDRDLNIGTFRSWLYSLHRAGNRGAEIQLLPVEVVSASKASPEADETKAEVVVVVAGVDVRVPVGTDTRAPDTTRE